MSYRCQEVPLVLTGGYPMAAGLNLVPHEGPVPVLTPIGTAVECRVSWHRPL